MPEAIASVRVLHLLPHQGVGGLQRCVIDLVRHERMDGATDEIVLTDRALDTDGDFMAPATPVHFLGLTDARLAVRAARLADLAASRGARAIHAYTSADLLLAAAACSRAGAPRLLATLFERPSVRGFLLRRRLRRAVQAADELFVPTPALRGDWRAIGRDPEVRLAAVDVQRFHPQPSEHAWRGVFLDDPETLLVGSLMRATEDKAPEVLIEAVERRQAAGRPTALMLVGDGPRFAELKERSRGSSTLHVRRRVLDAPGFFGRIDVFALQCPDELVPVSLVEALACGRPAVVADSGPVAELVGADVVDLVPHGDVEAVVKALDGLHQRSQREERGFAARQRAVERHALGRLRSELSPTYS
jgi:glycosyltransferase involved in cell wall biosynthesis